VRYSNTPEAGVEEGRLRDLARLRILDTGPEEAFDDVVALAAAQTGCPIAVITLVDSVRGWFKASQGIEAAELPRVQTFCAHAILSDRVLSVADATQDPRFQHLDVVTGEPHVRAYLGMPLTTARGHRIGALCVVDTTPRSFTPQHETQLRLLARIVGQLLETRAAALLARSSAEDSGQQLAASRHAGVVLDAMGDGVVVQDLTGTITDANPAACSILGLTLDEMQGRSSMDPRWRSIREDGTDLPGSEHPAMITLRTGQPVTGAIMGVELPDGERRWLRINSRPLVQPNSGACEGVIATFSDVSEAMRARGKLNRSAERLRMAMHLARACSFEVFPHGVRRSWFSDRLDELVGGPVAPEARLSDYIHPDDLPLLRASLRNAMRSQEPMHVRFRIGAEGGSGQWVEAYVQVDRDPRGRIARLVGLFKDVALEVAQSEELRELALAAEGANAAKTAFLANMGHEIRTPLNGVIGLASSLARTTLSPAQREMVSLIQDSGTSLLRLLNDLLDLSKAEAGRLDLEEAPFDLRATIDSAAHLMRVRADDKGVAFRVEYGEGADGHVLGDAVRLRQVVSNLASNAVKFTEQGEVVVAASLTRAPDGAEVLRIEVRDTGAGFDAETGARLFGRFVQADASTARKFGGTGLGLSICKSILGLMGGEIGASSVPGEGSCFWFEIPLVRCAAPRLTASELEAGTGMLEVAERVRVLLADDHPINQRVVSLMLEPFDVDVTCADHGREALDAFTATRFDAVLMDMQMPVMDGLTAVREIRALEAATGRAPTPIIMLSANAGEEHVAAGRAAGADLHVSKPVTPEALVEALEAALALRDAVADLPVSAAVA
jgi:PAS domain S-box-containing protein